MPCPNCGSYAITTFSGPHDDWYDRCDACGYIMSDPVFPDDDEDHCDHEWQEVYFADGTACDECVKCGAIDC